MKNSKNAPLFTEHHHTIGSKINIKNLLKTLALRYSLASDEYVQIPYENNKDLENYLQSS